MLDSLQVKKIDDPRDDLDKARRREMLDYAKKNNIQGIKPGMPALMMRRILRGLGINSIPIPRRVLGIPEPGSAPLGHKPPTPHGIAPAVPGKQGGPAVDAGDDLMRQWEQQEQTPAALEPAVERKASPLAEFQEARRLCKERGIPVLRTDKLADLKTKLNDQDSAERGQ